MANKSEKAAAAVTKLFKKKPGATTDEFLEVAVAADSSLKGIGKRSFNATYLLPLKRKAGAGKKKRGRKKTKATRRAKRTGRKKTAGPKRGRPRRRAAGGAGVSAAARERARQLILGRDRKVLNTLGKQGDPKAAYELGASLDTYIDDLAEALRG